jgi:hypothetical protein
VREPTRRRGAVCSVCERGCAPHSGDGDHIHGAGRLRPRTISEPGRAGASHQRCEVHIADLGPLFGSVERRSIGLICSRCSRSRNSSRPRLSRQSEYRRKAEFHRLLPQDSRKVEIVLLCALDRQIVAGIGMAHDTSGGIVPKHAFNSGICCLGTIATDHHAGVL